MGETSIILIEVPSTSCGHISIKGYRLELLISSAEGITMLSVSKLKFGFSNALNKSVAAVFPISKAG
jgi:hypothetical protein